MSLHRLIFYPCPYPPPCCSPLVTTSSLFSLSVSLLHLPSLFYWLILHISCIKPGLVTRFIYDIIHISMPFSKIIPPISLPIPSLWVIPVHQPRASCIMHWTWTGDLFHIWYYTCFNAILPNHPTLTLSHRVQKTVLYICVSFAVSYTGLLLPSF